MIKRLFERRKMVEKLPIITIMMKKGQPAMEDETEIKTKPAETVPTFSMRDLDDETIQILLDDKIATGG